MRVKQNNQVMKKQAELGLNLSTRRTHKAVFLDEMELVVPWRELIALIAAASPVASTGRPPFAHETMLRIHFLHQRSEEHTSELQSLMRISYAVFCLKKKNNNNKK